MEQDESRAKGGCAEEQGASGRKEGRAGARCSLEPNICEGATIVEVKALGLTAGGSDRDFFPGLEVQGQLFD